MRRFFSFTMTLLILLCLCGCDSTDQDIRVPVNFYYCTNPVTYNSPNGVISPETRESDGYRNNTTELLTLYLKGPVSDQYTSLFPAGVTVESVSQDGDTLKVMLSPQFADLTGLDLTIACACLSLTAMELTDAQSVEIRASGRQLDGSDSTTMTKDSLILVDNSISAPDSQ